jgi:osmotically-inducible protein OsmY
MVRLRGEVAAEGDRVLAEGLAVGVQGVRGLRNQILVVPGAGPMDRRLADRLQEHIDRRELRGADLPTILVHQGRVAVRGPMPDRRTLRRLIRISEAVPGAWNHPSERHRDGGDENAKTALGAVPRGK